KFSFDRVMDPETKSPNRKEVMSFVKEVKVLDDHTIQFLLKYPTPVFLYSCTRPRPVAIVSQKAVEKYGKDFARNPIGSGPFMLESFSRDQIVLVANKNYHEGPPRFDRVVYKMIPDNDTLLMALLKGDIHMVHSISRDKAILDRLFKGGGKLQVIDKGTYHQLHLNPRYKPLEDIRVRRAVAHGIDRDAIIEYVTTKMGTKLNSPVPKGYWGHNEEGLRRYDYDPKKAKELLAEAGYGNGFEVTLDTFQSPTYLPVAIAIQGQLEKVGIKVNLGVKDQNTWMANLSGGHSQMSLLFPTRHPDAHFPLVDFFSSAGFSPGLNLARYDKVDKEIEVASKEMDPQKRQKIYDEVQKRIMEDLPVIPLFMLPHPCAHSPKITGFPSVDFVWGYDFYNLRLVE
ncbi:MAG: ABC transporter substrate-binding protein, partial [Deltaproteobacteria bacterium]